MFRSISSDSRDSRDSRGRFVSRPSQEQDAGGKGVVATVKKDWPRIWPAQMEGNRWAPSSDHHGSSRITGQVGSLFGNEFQIRFSDVLTISHHFSPIFRIVQMFTFFLFIFFPLEACMPLSASPTSGPDWKDPNLWRSGRCDSGVLSVLCKVLSVLVVRTS